MTFPINFRPNRFLFAGAIPEKVILYEYSRPGHANAMGCDLGVPVDTLRYVSKPSMIRWVVLFTKQPVYQRNAVVFVCYKS